MRALIELGADVNAQDHIGQTPLHLAIELPSYSISDQDRKRRMAVARYLLDHHADPNAQKAHWGTTPLHRAVATFNREAVKLLLDYGAAVDIQDKYGDTPLDLARKIQLLDMVDMMEKQQAAKVEEDGEAK